MKKLSLKELLDKYTLGRCSPEEKTWVEDWYANQDTSSDLLISDQEFSDDLEAIYSKLPTKTKTRFIKREWLKFVALFIGGVVVIGMFFYTNRETGALESNFKIVQVYDIEPGSNKATLRLTDGSLLLLDDLEVGEIYQHKDFRFRKSEDGQIEYLKLGEEVLVAENIGNIPSQNEISTPKGGHFKVVLPDGSKVWLNASSTLKYPNKFSPKERVVELSGEAYFEVNKQSTPFYVHTTTQRIEVLGTHFNVNAYKDESEVKTTLVEGSVKISADSRTGNIEDVFLKPGEQARLVGEKIEVKEVDVSQFIAWKEGFFSFRGADLEMVMREFSRWYGVDVEFEGDLPNTKLWGEVYRDAKASQALAILEYYDLKFKIIKEKGISKIEIFENKSFN